MVVCGPAPCQYVAGVDFADRPAETLHPADAGENVEVWPAGWVCQAVRAPGSNRTTLARTLPGAASTIGSCQTAPVK
jgi:hypothetical protein